MTEAFSYLVFADVDGTLINTRSLLGFLEYYRRALELDGEAWFLEYLGQIRSLLSSSTSRTRLNAFYYTVFRGQRPEVLERLGEGWFAEASARPGFFNDKMMQDLAVHQARGAGVVLVTGSFAAIINPLARALSCVAVLCTRLEVADGVCTGAVAGVPCIGERKAEEVRAFAGQYGVPLDKCIAYGDDQTDAPMLKAVGRGYLVESAPAYHRELANWNPMKSRSDVVSP